MLLFRSRKTPLKKKILSSFSLAVMLGLSWVTGYILLITQEKNLRLILSVVFQNAQKAYNGLKMESSMLLYSLSFPFSFPKGIQIFILFALRPFLNSNPAILNSLRAPEIGFHKKSFFFYGKIRCQKTKKSTNPHMMNQPDRPSKVMIIHQIHKSQYLIQYKPPFSCKNSVSLEPA